MAGTSSERSSYFPAIEKRYGKPMDFWFHEMKRVQGQRYQDQMDFLQGQHGFGRTHANALVQYCRGSKTSKRFEDFDGYLTSLPEEKQRTFRSIFNVLLTAFPNSQVVIAWNQPMLKIDGKYVFGASASKNHILIAPFDADLIDAFRARLTAYEVNKKTIRVPPDWQVDEALLIDLVGAKVRT